MKISIFPVISVLFLSSLCSSADSEQTRHRQAQVASDFLEELSDLLGGNTTIPIREVDGNETDSFRISLPDLAIVYTVLVEDGKEGGGGFLMEDEMFELIWTVDSLVAENAFQSLDEEQLQTSGLQLTFPSAIANTEDVGFANNPDITDDGFFVGGPCPVGSRNSMLDLCLEVTSLVGLSVEPQGSSFLSLQQTIQRNLNDALEAGDLQEILVASFPNSTLAILSGQDLSNFTIVLVPSPAPTEAPPTSDTKAIDEDVDDEDVDDDDGLAGGAIAGIVIFALLAMVGVGIVVGKNSNRKGAEKTKSSIQKSPNAGGVEADREGFTGLEWGDSARQNGDNMSHRSEEMDAYSVDAPSSSKNSNGNNVSTYDMYKFLEDQDNQSLGNQSKDSYLESSAAGSENAEGIEVSQVVSIDMGDKLLKDAENAKTEQSTDEANYKDLESAIMAGNWAAMASSAQHLAALQHDSESEHQSTTSDAMSYLEEASRELSIRSETWQKVIDVKKAAELDQLISQGNWAGIMDAAARYEAEVLAIREITEDAEC